MRLLILGTGWMAQEHARRFSAIEGAVIVGAVDVDPARVGEFADNYKIAKRFTSLEAALDCDRDEWFEALDELRGFYAQFGSRLPAPIWEAHAQTARRFRA